MFRSNMWVKEEDRSTPGKNRKPAESMRNMLHCCKQTQSSVICTVEHAINYVEQYVVYIINRTCFVQKIKLINVLKRSSTLERLNPYSKS